MGSFASAAISASVPVLRRAVSDCRHVPRTLVRQEPSYDLEVTVLSGGLTGIKMIFKGTVPEVRGNFGLSNSAERTPWTGQTRHGPIRRILRHVPQKFQHFESSFPRGRPQLEPARRTLASSGAHRSPPRGGERGGVPTFVRLLAKIVDSGPFYIFRAG
eukprot:7172-Pelagococcus_subviridis.AAC.1